MNSFLITSVSMVSVRILQFETRKLGQRQPGYSSFAVH